MPGVSQVNPASILGPDGPIARRLGSSFESRPEQTLMAEAVASALHERTRLLAEAGTGVGKSFAYLVPAILRCLLHGEKVVIATATIALQEQLMTKDIPLLVETLADWGLPQDQIRASLVPVLAKGRGNYLSIRRLKLASARQDSLLVDAEAKRSLHAIEDWAYTTADGSLSTLPMLERPDVWEHVRSDSDNCMGRKCQTYKTCFYQSARRELEKANLIICNHALFFSDLALRSMRGFNGGGSGSGGGGGGAILPPYDHVILDEAHGLEDTAGEHFGLTLTQPRVLRLLRTLYSPRRRKGFLLDKSLAVGDAGVIDRAITLVGEADEAARVFFDELLDYSRQHRAEAMPGGSAGGSARGGDAGSWRVRTPDIVSNPLTPAMRELALCLRRIRDQLDNENERFDLSSFAKRTSDIADTAEALVSQTLSLPRDPAEMAQAEPNDDRESSGEETAGGGGGGGGFVYWLEVERSSGGGGGGGGGGRTLGPRVSLCCAPVDVAPILRRLLFTPSIRLADVQLDEGRVEAEPTVDAPPACTAVRLPVTGVGGSAASPSAPKRLGIVLTSATLATRTAAPDEHTERAETAFSHIINNLGLPQPPDTRMVQLGSPFDYPRQARVYVDTSMPSPRALSAPGNARGGSRGALEGVGGSAQSAYIRELARRVTHHVGETGGGAFVLFTSFATLLATADACAHELDNLSLSLLVQGRDGSRQALLQKYLESDRSVLFGAASFWQGVDVRGERLRNVIITRLPFEPPDRPLTQARIERIELAGGNPFSQDSLPRAIIRFKQGFGRLIRSRTDKGRIVVLDPRVLTAGYGRLFLEALPGGIPIITPADDPEAFGSGRAHPDDHADF